jgi:hypothetical protein
MKKVDWDVVQVVLIVGMLPVMLVIGAVFPSLFATY